MAELSHEFSPDRNLVNTASASCGIPGIDSLRLPRGELTEIVVEPPAAGCGLVVSALLEREIVAGNPVALVDAGDCFDVAELGDLPAAGLLLWVRCRERRDARKNRAAAGSNAGKHSSGRVATAIKVADLLLRDGNLATVLLDLQGCRQRELGAVVNSAWFRLRSLAAATAVRCLVFTPRPMVASARLRIDMGQRELSLDALDDRREDIHPVLSVKVLRDRRGARQIGEKGFLRVG